MRKKAEGAGPRRRRHCSVCSPGRRGTARRKDEAGVRPACVCGAGGLTLGRRGWECRRDDSRAAGAGDSAGRGCLAVLWKI